MLNASRLANARRTAPCGYHVLLQVLPVLVLVHGFAASLHTWRPWAEELQDAYRVVTLDLPGHGLSRVPQDRHDIEMCASSSRSNSP